MTGLLSAKGMPRPVESRVIRKNNTLSRIVPGCVPDSEFWLMHSPYSRR